MQVFTDNASAVVSSGGTTTTSTSWTVSSTGYVFPTSLVSGNWFHVCDPALPAEKMRVTAVSGSGPYTWTVTRGDDGTTAVAHASGFTVQQVVSATDFGVFSQTFNVMAYGATGNGTTNDTTAVQAAITACLAAGGGTVFFPAGTYYVTNLTCTGTGEVSVAFRGEGQVSHLVCYATSGDLLHYYSSSNVSPNSFGGVYDLQIDGSNASSGVNGLHFGDLTHFTVDNVLAHVFTGTGGSSGVPFLFDNNNSWTEALKVRVACEGCTGGNVVLTVSGTTGNTEAGTGTATSFRDAEIYVDIASGSADAVRLQAGAYIYYGEVVVRGSLPAGTTAGSSLNLTGQAAGSGVIIDGPDAYSQINDARIDIGMECDNTSTTQPTTINFASVGNNVMTGCYGQLKWEGTWTNASSTAGNSMWPFFGPITGDSNLQLLMGSSDADAWTTPGGIGIGDWSGTQTIATGGTITTAANGIARITSTANVTGVILQAGTVDGQIVSVMNLGTHTVTFAAAGTSFVSDGTSDNFASGASHLYLWDGNNSLWHHMT